ncbi:GtrA family protein [Companilactobacillus sp. RD055328]|uniref:GtrA family protein n=1 Tax=Companilactobacillus sp. RD055328 TaxID=2916634 RepID=UPI001FC854F7|nr:GtrA family protein [Companilactobacillus sp. RD055328]
MKSLFNKYRNFFIYAIFGFLASLINVLFFNFYHVNLNKTIVVSNTLAWFIANLFSFFCNKHIVFKNGTYNYSSYFRELSSFFSTRLFSWVADMAIMYIGIWLVPSHPVIVKIIDQVLIGIFNYVITRIIFIHDNSPLLKRKKSKKNKK